MLQVTTDIIYHAACCLSYRMMSTNWLETEGYWFVGEFTFGIMIKMHRDAQL